MKHDSAYWKETNQEYTEKFVDRFEEYSKATDGTWHQFIEGETEYLQNSLWDIENSEASANGHSFTGIENFNLISKIVKEIGSDKFFNSIKRKIAFLEEMSMQPGPKITIDPIATLEKFHMLNSFDHVRKELDQIESTKEKLIHLLRIRATFTQEEDPERLAIEEVTNNALRGRTFIEKCDIEINLLKDLLEIESNQTDTHNDINLEGNVPRFKLTNKEGAKTNLIRILNALYGLGYLENYDQGDKPSKNDFFNAFGQFLGEDLSTFQRTLSQSRNDTSLDASLQVFKKMIELTEKEHNSSK